MYGTYLTAKEYLSQAYYIGRRINSQMKQARSLRTLAEMATAYPCETPIRGTHNVHRMEDTITKMIDMEEEIETALEQLIDLKQEISTLVKCVSNPELQALLELRYLCYMTWEEIAEELHYDPRHIRRLHGQALSQIESIRHSRRSQMS